MSPIYVPGKVVLAKQFTWNETVWNPSMISTALWLDANDSGTVIQSSSLVSQWNDKSGNIRHATASTTARPTYSGSSFNSKPGLTFDGTANVLRADGVASIVQGNDAPFSVAAVFSATSGSTFRNVCSFGSSASGDFFHAFQIDDLNNLTQSRRLTSAPLVQKNITGTSGTSTNLALVYTFLGTTGFIYKNGTQDATGDLDVDTFGTNTNQFAIGALARNTSAGFLAFTLSELIVTVGVFSTLNRQKTEGYLAHKWGLTANLPSDHPYKTVGPTP